MPQQTEITTAEARELLEQYEIALHPEPAQWDLFCKVAYELGTDAAESAQRSNYGEPGPDFDIALQALSEAFHRVQQREQEE